MNTHIFTAEDTAGRRCRIRVLHYSEGHEATSAAVDAHPLYVLEDGSRVRRIDNDTFLVVQTGAYVTRVID